MREFCASVIEAAKRAGASYADVRVTDSETQSISVRNGIVEGIESGASFGFGVRVIARGAWGFAASSEVTPEAAERAAREAVAIARASASVGAHYVSLAPVDAYDDCWAGPVELDPFAVDVETKLGVLLACDEAMRSVEGVALTRGEMSFLRVRKTFASTEGSMIDQAWTESSAGIVAYAIGDGEVFSRSYPNSHGGGCYQGGWETIAALDLPSNADRIAKEAVALLSAPECPGDDDLARARREPDRAAGPRVGRPRRPSSTACSATRRRSRGRHGCGRPTSTCCITDRST